MLKRALLQCFLMLVCSEFALNKKWHPYKGRRYDLTLFIRNHNVTDATFFRLVGVDNTADFNVSAGNTFEHTFEVVRRKGYWTLFVEFPGDRYAKSPQKVSECVVTAVTNVRNATHSTVISVLTRLESADC
ncbi:hypothetical protein ANCDUO_17453 [Ancylostoma duodenale]|uniref:Uncharacterized protein n=1 Tax=Ancylostoma duodenale TaxID=51022 RepID=A0A0C2FV66_9BILA|nr:hypothetical protein ANCDUO_17453 [Ancylostoma duodenale]